ncbi:MAG TPA: C25 family cysteine peptidase, partial [Chloroflexota bacterium]|nr:C25 family cysteine peptidase [Chloroflexota bacterium]
FLPVTVEIEQLAGADLNGPIVFADASYAGNLVAKTTTQSLTLRFLAEGATAVVGPTGLAYGSPQLPLGSGDLLGYLFWSEVGRGVPTGEALRRARQNYLTHVVERQGFLDGEDQKLLLQYTLYGDPSLALCAAGGDDSENPAETHLAPVLCGEGGSSSLPPRQLRQAMEELVVQCPGVVPRGIRVHQLAFCEGNCQHPGHATAPLGEAGAITTVSARLELPTDNGGQLVKIARVTLDAGGGIQKLVVSR